jgi:acetoin utilization protein AcuB
MLVKDRMTPNPITILPDATHRQAAELMREHHIHHLPVLDKGGNLVGIVVEQDLLAAQPSPATTLSIYEIHGLLSKLQIKQIMTHPVHTTAPDCPIEEAARVMLSEDIGCLPVVEGGKVVGIITDHDIFGVLVTLLGGGEEGARFTLQVANKPGVLAKVAQIVADAGGNIISVTAWHEEGSASPAAYITIKEQGANFAQLKPGLESLDAELIDLRENPTCPRQTFG